MKSLFAFIIVLFVLFLLFGNNKSGVGPSSLKNISGVKVQQIPQKYYDNTIAEDDFYNILHDTQKHIFWAYADCKYGRAIKQNVDTILASQNLSSYYVHDANLMSGGLAVFCKTRTVNCAANFLYEKCSEGICVINPKTKQYFVVNFNNPQKLMSVLSEAKSW